MSKKQDEAVSVVKKLLGLDLGSQWSDADEVKAVSILRAEIRKIKRKSYVAGAYRWWDAAVRTDTVEYAAKQHAKGES